MSYQHREPVTSKVDYGEEPVTSELEQIVNSKLLFRLLIAGGVLTFLCFLIWLVTTPYGFPWYTRNMKHELIEKVYLSMLCFNVEYNDHFYQWI